MNFVDFFAGIGGIRLGLEQAGHKCVGFCEFDKYARTAYKAMYDTEGEDVKPLSDNGYIHYLRLFAKKWVRKREEE